MKNIYHLNDGIGNFRTWTQVKQLTEWPPGERAVFMFYKGYILVGASCKDTAELDVWRRKHSVSQIPKQDYTDDDGYTAKASNKYEQAWLERYQAGMRQGEIAKQLGVSPAYVSILKRRYLATNFG